MPKIRLTDIAAQAGVSEATVSRVLNRKPNVSAATTQQVLTALDVLGYERPLQLRRARVGLVGIITPELENPIFPALATIIERALATSGYTSVVCTQTPGAIHEDEYSQMLLDRGAAGIIYLSGLHADNTISPDRYRRLLDAGLPLVMVNGYMPALADRVPFISDDDHNALDQAVVHLTNLGHTRIGLAVGPDRYLPVIRKIDGYHAALHRHQPGHGDDLIEHTNFDIEGGTIAATRLIARGATAIICASDLMALGAIAGARAAGLNVPRDISIIGYDDSKLVGYTDPPLTTLRQNVVTIGEAAAQALLTQLAGHPTTGERLYRPELIIRGTTAAANEVTAQHS